MRRATWCGALAALALQACSEVPPEYDPIEWGNAASAEVAGWFGKAPDPNRPVRVEPPPAEGRPFPNLATVPRPPQVTPAADRQAELDRLMQDRSGARAAPRPGPTAPAGATGQSVGRVAAPASGAGFSEADRNVLRQAMSAVAASPGGLRLVGAPAATDAVAAELRRMGLPADLTRSEPRPAGRQVEIFVDY